MSKTNEKLITQIAISELERLSLSLDTELEVVANMPIEEVEDNLRQMGLDPNQPLPPNINKLASERSYGQESIFTSDNEVGYSDNTHSNKDHTVFISHSSSDTSFRDELREFLKHTFHESVYITMEDVYQKAFSRAAYSLGDLDLAEKVTVEVAESFDTLCKPGKFSIKPRKSSHPYKKEPNESLILDSLIFKKIFPYKKQIEMECRIGERQLDEDTTIIWFIDSLMEYAIDHGSSYLAIGICNLLYNYDLHDVVKIYKVLNPESPLELDVYRRRKKRMVDAIEKRFKYFFKFKKTNHNQKVLDFRKYDNSSHIFWLVKDWLNHFTLTEPTCSLVYNDNNLNTYIYELFNLLIKQEPNEHLAEQARIHTLLHPLCFSNLVKHLNIPSSEECLMLPAFMPNNSAEWKYSFDIPKQTLLDQKRKERIDATLNQQRKRRENMNVDTIAVAIDGVEQQVISLDKCTDFRLKLKEDSSVVEFRGHDKQGSIPLGTHVLNWNKGSVTSSPHVYYLRLHGEHVLRHTIKYTTDAKGNLNGAMIEGIPDFAGV
jgi:hypothetical protein